MQTKRTTIALGLAWALAAGSSQAAQAAECAGLMQPGLVADTVVSAARDVAAADGLPAYCEVEATNSSAPGSKIVTMTRLPMDWNGKLLAAGGGGFAGDTKLETVAPALKRGYATIGTNMGHAGTESLGMEWMITEKGKLNEVVLADFGERAAHVSAIVGKELIKAYYGRPQTQAYWQGCSTGGRQGMTESQRHPEDFDGIIAGAPVFSWVLYSQSIQRAQFFRNTPGALITKEQVPLIRDAVVTACDGLDGVKDGYLTNPLACSWDPAEIECKEGQAAGAQCLSKEQAGAVRKLYAGYVTPDGLTVSDPTMRGGEGDWTMRFVGIPPLPKGLNVHFGGVATAYLYKLDPEWDPLSFDPDTEMAELLRTKATQHMIPDNPDISPFVKRGGKMLLWHGFNDSGPSALQTLHYYKQMEAVVAPQIDTPVTDSVRYFLAPGVGHCGGGAGPDRFDMLTALENWVEKGEAPERIIASKKDSEMTRPLCPYPTIATYKGSGNTDDAANFDCAPMNPAE
ncbi:tannase/feruloyl esterase family alpha/beta hydrolase [Oryzicola mucosus]|nr:tannase/feruloyl esterase family alpha/beta hydrolase [Oryzicola mucosus]